jgi:hypothetical protein
LLRPRLCTKAFSSLAPLVLLFNECYLSGRPGPGTILLFDRDHPSVPTYTRDMLTRAATVQDGPPSGHRFSGAKRP